MNMMEWIRFNLITPLVEQLFPAVIHAHAAITIEIVLKIVVILVPVLFTVAYLTYAERKVIGYIQGRIGPNRVGFFGLSFWGLGQPIADAFKLIFKEIIVPFRIEYRALFVIAPILSFAPSIAAWAVIPFWTIR